MLRQGLIALILLVICLIGAMMSGWTLLYNAAYALAILLLICALLVVNDVFRVDVQRHTRTLRSQVGRYLEENFTFINHSILPKRWLEMRDHSTLPGHRAGRVLTSVGPRQRRSWYVRTYCTQRGRYTLGPITLHSSDPFGFFALQRRRRETREVLIYPYTADISEFHLPFGELSGGSAFRRRTHHVTDNVAGVRDYVHGDSFNRIHWKSTARTGRLISKEFELDPATDIWIYLDLDRSVHVSAPWQEEAEEMPAPALLRPQRAPQPLPPSTAEYSIALAASLARYWLLHGRAVGMVAYGRQREVLSPDRGQRQLLKVLEKLAVLEAEGTAPLHLVLAAETARLSRGSNLVVVTPAADTAWVHVLQELSLRGVHAATALVVAESFAPAPSQDLLLAELAASNIPVFTVQEGEDLAQALRRPWTPTHRAA